MTSHRSRRRRWVRRVLWAGLMAAVLASVGQPAQADCASMGAGGRSIEVCRVPDGL